MRCSLNVLLRPVNEFEARICFGAKPNEVVRHVGVPCGESGYLSNEPGLPRPRSFLVTIEKWPAQLPQSLGGLKVD